MVTRRRQRRPISQSDLEFIAALGQAASLSAAGQSLGVSTAAVSKHLSLMEKRLSVTLVHRGTRRMSLTPEGETYYSHARRILSDMDRMSDLLDAGKDEPRGLLRVNATLGFGRLHVAPLIDRFVEAYPQVQVHLTLSNDAPPLSEETFDVGIRFGTPPDARIVAKRIARNRRILCASPRYLASAGAPSTIDELARHRCIAIFRAGEPPWLWHLARNGDEAAVETVQAHGRLVTNYGEVAVQWALAGHGIVLRAEWDVRPYLKSGRLVALLPGYAVPGPDLHLIFWKRRQLAARVAAFVAFAADVLRDDSVVDREHADAGADGETRFAPEAP